MGCQRRVQEPVQKEPPGDGGFILIAWPTPVPQSQRKTVRDTVHFASVSKDSPPHALAKIKADTGGAQ